MWSTHVIPGTYFASHDGSIVSVARLQDNNVFCVMKDTGEAVVYSLQEAADLLQRYIG